MYFRHKRTLEVRKATTDCRWERRRPVVFSFEETNQCDPLRLGGISLPHSDDGHALGQWFSNRGSFASQGTFGNSRRHLGLPHFRRGVVSWHLTGLQRPVMLLNLLQCKDRAPNVSRAEAEKPIYWVELAPTASQYPKIKITKHKNGFGCHKLDPRVALTHP